MQLIKAPNKIDLFSINPMLIGVSTNTDLTEENLRCDMILIDVASPENPIRLSGYYDDNSEVYFNISKLLNLGFDLPAFATLTSSTVAKASSSIKEYTVRIEEFYGEDVEDFQDDFDYEENFAIAGGMDDIKFRYYDWYDDFHTNVKFLTHQPHERLVTREQPNYFYYPTLRKNQTGFGDDFQNTLRVKLKYSDATEETISLSAFNFESTPGELHIIPVGFLQLNLSSYETDDKKIISYTIDMKILEIDGSIIPDGDQPIIDNSTYSEAYTYYIDFKKQSWPKRYFLFRNSLGGIDVICTRGKAKLKSNFSRQVSGKTDGLNPPIHQHRENNNNIFTQQEKTVNIGWTSEEERIWIEDLFISKKAWEIDLQKQILVPIRITSTSFDIEEDDQPLQDASFTFVYSQKNAL